MPRTPSSTEDRPKWLRFEAGDEESHDLFAPGANWRKQYQYPALKPLDSYTRNDYPEGPGRGLRMSGHRTLRRQEGTRLQVMRSAAEEAARSGQSQIAVPVAIKVRGTGRMGKAESGWHFAGMPAFSTVEIVTANATYPRFKSDAAASTSTPSEARRLVGKVRAGNTDSCLEVTVSRDSKCYTLPGESEVAPQIFNVCQDGDMCAITGQFDDKSEKLIQFSKAEKVAP